MNEHQHLEALALAVREARLATPEQVKEICARADVSAGTWHKVEKGIGVNAISLRKIEKALGWSPGTVAAILATGEPPAPGAESQGPDTLAHSTYGEGRTTPVESTKQREDIRFTIGRPPGLSDADLERVLDKARDYIRWQIEQHENGNKG